MTTPDHTGPDATDGPETPDAADDTRSSDAIAHREESIDEELEETFPSSDPSSTWAGPEEDG